jgi:uncharacterized membrane protein YgaE (UPF0421/DUF939 family)
MIKSQNKIMYTVVNLLNIFLPLLRRANPTEPVVEKSVILIYIFISQTDSAYHIFREVTNK